MLETSYKREEVAIFTGKCAMLYEILLCYPDEEDDILAKVLESLFMQSERILGFH